VNVPNFNFGLLIESKHLIQQITLAVRLLLKGGLVSPFLPAKGTFMHYFLRVLCCLLLLLQANILGFTGGRGGIAAAQGSAIGEIPRGSRVVIAPMGGFETYFAAAVREKKVPITLTLDKDSAQYFIVSTETEWQGFVYGSAASANWKGAWAGSSGSSTRGLEASIMLIDAKTKDVMWAYEVHKSSHGALLFGTLAARGKQSVAEACAKHLKDFIDKVKDGGPTAPVSAQVAGANGALPNNFANSPVSVASTVAVSSVPAGADIYVDQDFVGNTPSTVNVQFGKHSVVLKKTGFQDWVRDMSFSGGNINLNAELLPGSTPPSAQAVKKQAIVTDVPSSAAVPAATGRPGWIGISTKYIGNSAALITEVVPGGPAARAGLRAGDIVTSLNAIPTKDEDPNAKITAYKSGSKVRVGYMRDSWALEATVTVATNMH